TRPARRSAPAGRTPARSPGARGSPARTTRRRRAPCAASYAARRTVGSAGAERQPFTAILVDNRRLRLGKRELAGPPVDLHGVAFAELALEHLDRERIEDAPLYRALQRTRAVRRIVALLDEQILGTIGQLDVDLAVLVPFDQPPQLDVDDRPHLPAR